MKATLSIPMYSSNHGVDGYSSSSTSSTSSSSTEAAMWSGFLIEQFPEFGSAEFQRLKNVEWPKFGLNAEQGYNKKPFPPTWFEHLKDKELKKKLEAIITTEHNRIVEKNHDSIEEPPLGEEIMEQLRSMVPLTSRIKSPVTVVGPLTSAPALERSASLRVVKGLRHGEMEELTKYFWELKHTLFKQQAYPNLWADLLGDTAHATRLYMDGIQDGDRLKGPWGLILSEALRFERSFEGKEECWEHIRRYQNLDNSEIRPLMTVYREIRDELAQEDAELMDAFFGTLPDEAFPTLNPKLGFFRKQNIKNGPKKRPLSISMNVLMISDIDTVHQRFTCMFRIMYCWKQSLNGARNYYIKEQLDELDEMSTDKEKVFKAEWKPPEPILKNAIETEIVSRTQPHVQDGCYNTLHSTITYRAKFSEKLELENFPFDCQEFTMSMEFKGSDFLLKGKDEGFISIDWKMFALDEWKLSTHAVDCMLHRVNSRETSNNITVSFKLQRDPSSYMWKLAVTSFMIVSGTFMFFGINNDQLADRLGYIATMFLTGQAFQVVATSETPSLGYLTIIDYFLVVGNVFIYLQFGFATIIRFFASPLDEDDSDLVVDDEDDFSDINPSPSDPINVICFAISSGMYFIFICIWFGYARFYSIPMECFKLNASDLNIASRGFVYILTYKDSEDDKLANNKERGSIMALSKGLATKTASITKIVGKRVEDSAPVYRVLSGRDLKNAIKARDNNLLPSFVQNPSWKTENIDHKNAQKKLRKSRREDRKKNPQSPGPFESEISEENQNLETKI